MLFSTFRDTTLTPSTHRTRRILLTVFSALLVPVLISCQPQVIELKEVNPKVDTSFIPFKFKVPIAIVMDEAVKDAFTMKVGGLVPVEVQGFRKSMQNVLKAGFSMLFDQVVVRDKPTNKGLEFRLMRADTKLLKVKKPKSGKMELPFGYQMETHVVAEFALHILNAKWGVELDKRITSNEIASSFNEFNKVYEDGLSLVSSGSMKRFLEKKKEFERYEKLMF